MLLHPHKTLHTNKHLFICLFLDVYLDKALFVTKTWKQPRWPSIWDWINKQVMVHPDNGLFTAKNKWPSSHGKFGGCGAVFGNSVLMEFFWKPKTTKRIKKPINTKPSYVLYSLAKELQQLWQSLFGKPQVQNTDIHIFRYQATLRMTKTEHRHHWDY